MYPDLIYVQPEWQRFNDGWSCVIPQAEDTRFLANLTHHADLNINVASTMTLDFAIHDKPVVNIAFDVASPPPFKSSLWEHHYRFEHYLPVIELKAARFARSPHELAKHINEYLDDPSLDRKGRRKFVELEVSLPLGDSSQRIAEVIEKISRDWRPPHGAGEDQSRLAAEGVRA
jgi:CDP-glycerol glycerophosphotransferase (TagB/SpsB family)